MTNPAPGTRGRDVPSYRKSEVVFDATLDVELVACPDCAFTWDAFHDDSDAEGPGWYTCPVCEVKALREIAAHMLRRIERDIPDHARIDHACRQCIPDGESISEDFVCAIHRARALLPTPSGEGEG